MNRIVYCVYLCDVWKSTNSMSLHCICTSIKRLNSVVKKLLKEKTIELKDGNSVCYNQVNLVNELNNKIDYLYIEDVRLNEEI